VFCRVPIVALVLATFVVTTAVPGPGVVAHRHTGGDHAHLHAFLVADHDHHGEAAHARRHRGHAHRPCIGRATHDPLQHTHFTSPFQPATPSHVPAVVSAILVAVQRPSTPRCPLADRPTVRSRGPPFSVFS